MGANQTHAFSHAKDACLFLQKVVKLVAIKNSIENKHGTIECPQKDGESPLSRQSLNRISSMESNAQAMTKISVSP